MLILHKNKKKNIIKLIFCKHIIKKQRAKEKESEREREKERELSKP